MANSIPEALGRLRRLYITDQTTFGTPNFTVAGADAVKMRESHISYAEDRHDRMDSRQTEGLVERIEGKATVGWSMSGYVNPPGDQGTTRPQLGQILEAAMGVETLNAGVSYAYSFSSAQTGLDDFFMMTQEFGGTWMEQADSCWVDTFTVSGSGGDPISFSAEGGGRNVIFTGRTTLNGALSGGETTIPVNGGLAFEANSTIQIGTSTNHAVLTAAAGTITVTPAVVGAQSNGATVAPYVPAEVAVGSPIAGVNGTITLAGVAVPITSIEINVERNSKSFDDEVFQKYTTGFIRGFRSVKGSLGFRVRQDTARWIVQRKQFTTYALAVTFGRSGAPGNGRRLVATLGIVELDFSDIDIPEAEEATVNCPFTAYASSTTANDELTLAFT